LYASPYIIRAIKPRGMRWVEHVACMGEVRITHNTLAGNPEGKRPLGRPKHRWRDDIRMDFREVRWQGVDWM